MIKRGQELKELLKKYDHAYYVLNKSIINDAEYDRLLEEYTKIEEEYPELKTIDSPTQRVGSEPISKLEKVEHPSPLLSINQKDKTEEGLRKFYKDCGGNGVEILIQPKYDGLTVDNVYNNNLLEYAATRGNGYIGEVITHNIKTIKSVPLRIDFKNYLEVRGEGVVKFDDFINLYSEDYSNPRNLASGTLRNLDSSQVKRADVIFFDIGKCDKEFNTDNERLEYLKELGFKVTPYILVNNEEDLIKVCTSYMNGYIVEKNGFNVLDIPNSNVTDIVCDGLVLKVNDLHLREEIGFTAKGPKWAFAYKFKSLTAETKLLDIEWGVGRTGKITPTGIFEEVNLGGTKITRATLNNIDYIKSLDLKLGDTIIIERANDVIPRVIECNKEKRNGTEIDIEMLNNCPICNSPLVEIYPQHFCENINCLARLKASIEHFASRDAMNIDGLGNSIIDLFVDNGYLKSLKDLYFLSQFKDEIINLEGFGKKKVDKLLKAIENSKTNDFTKVLYALQIKEIGKKSANILAQHYKNIDNLINTTKEELLSIEDIGEITSNEILNYFNNKQNIELINDLKEIGLCFELIENENTTEYLKGQTFVVTGSFGEYKRKYFEEKITQNGGKVSSSVSKKTTVVLVGEDAGSKETKARELIAKGEKIILLESYEEFINYLQKHSIDN